MMEFPAPLLMTERIRTSQLSNQSPPFSPTQLLFIKLKLLSSVSPPPSTHTYTRSKMADQKKPAIVFFHPDLGIGGAERLVVDAAVGLQERGHRVVIFTNHCDPKHCFEECRDGIMALTLPLGYRS